MKVIMIVTISVALTALAGILFINNFSDFGTRPNGQDKLNHLQSKQYNSDKGKFENTNAIALAEMKKKSFSFKILKDWLLAGGERVPNEHLPEMKPDIGAFLQPTDKLKVIWFGHSSFMLNMDGTVVLVDPVFSKSASPFGFLAKRFQEPVLSLNELPEIDYILISHDHYDHLDMESVKFFVNKRAKFIAPLGVGAHLKGWGISDDRITEKDWWQEVNFTDIKFIATPAQHFSGRDGIHENETLWASWVIQSKNHNVYFSGDSGYSSHFKEIGQRHGPFDVAFLENGQYNEAWKEIHMLPEETALAFQDLNAKKLFPVHWGMFDLSLHSWYDPIEEIFTIADEKGINLVAPLLGQVVNVNDFYIAEKWWKKESALVLNAAGN